MTAETPAEPAQAFAALMSEAAKAVKPEVPEAPYGWTTDSDGTRRPKKVSGRPKKSPSLDDLKASKEAAPPLEGVVTPGDAAPAAPGRRRKRRAGEPKPAKTEEPTPQHRPGVITKGVNKLYRKAGKIVQVMDPAIGFAIIESTKNTADEGEADDSVGAAWDEVARTNPRIRKTLLKLIAGGAWGQLLMAHAPILLAILMKDGISKHIPFMKLMTAFLDDGTEAAGDEAASSPGGLSGILDGLQPEDLNQMAAMAQSLMMGTAAKVADPAGARRPPAAA